MSDDIELLGNGAQNNEILYDDKFINITNNHIFLKKYYFPTATSKKIAFTDIESICTDHEYGLNALGYKTWGMGIAKVYWAYVGFNPKNLFILKEKGASLSCGFAVENVEEFSNILKSNNVPMHKKEK